MRGRRGWTTPVAVRRGQQKCGGDNDKNWHDNGKNWSDNNKHKGGNGASGISRLLGAAKLQSTLGTDNPH